MHPPSLPSLAPLILFSPFVRFLIASPTTTTMLSALQKGSRAALRNSNLGVSRISARGFAKDIKFGTEGRAAMLRGVDTLADAVQVRHSDCVLAQESLLITTWLDIFIKGI